MRHEVVVVGNGPSGSVAAQFSAKRHDTAIVGGGQRRVQCAGLISKTGMERIGAKGDFILNTIRGAKIHSPGGVRIDIDGRKPMAYAVDRLLFDKHLLDRAVAAGADYIEDRVTSLNGGLQLQNSGTIKADKVVLATGTDYTLQIMERIERPTEFLVGGQYEMQVECDPDFVELHFCVPDFFAWVIPIGDRARIGLCVKGNPRPHLDRFVGRLKREGRIRSGRVFAESFGIIPFHKPKMRTQFGNIVTVGDAAGQVKATTGGGIVYGTIAAEYATSPDYERIWRQKIGSDLRLHLMLYRMLHMLSAKNKDRFFSIVRDRHAVLEDVGDMDNAKKTLTGMLKDPGFVAKTAINMPWLLTDLL